MATLTVRDPKDMVAEHLVIIRGRAERMLAERESLSASGEADADSRVAEFFAIGSSFKLTEREMVVLFFGGLFPPPPTSRCGCPTCSRRVKRT